MHKAFRYQEHLTPCEVTILQRLCREPAPFYDLAIRELERPAFNDLYGRGLLEIGCDVPGDELRLTDAGREALARDAAQGVRELLRQDWRHKRTGEFLSVTARHTSVGWILRVAWSGAPSEFVMRRNLADWRRPFQLDVFQRVELHRTVQPSDLAFDCAKAVEEWAEWLREGLSTSNDEEEHVRATLATFLRDVAPVRGPNPIDEWVADPDPKEGPRWSAQRKRVPERRTNAVTELGWAA